LTAIAPKTLDEVCEFIVDCLHATAPTQDDGYPLIRTPNIGRGRLSLDGVYRVDDDTYERWTRRAVPQQNDLILAREAPAGNVAIIKNGQTVCLGQRTVHLRPDPEQVDPDFLCYFLLHPLQQGELLAGETGATSTHVNMRDIRRLPLRNLPSRETQARTGLILSAYDDLIENNTRRIKLLEDAARLLYEEWFVRLRFPGHEHTPVNDGVPRGWEMKTLEEVGYLNYGKALKADTRVEGSVPVFGSSGIVGTHNKPLTEGPGIIVGRKGNVGSVHLSHATFWPIDTVYFISADQFSYYLFHNLQYQNFINGDAAVPGLNRNFAHSLPVLIPQQLLVEEFERTARTIYAQIDKLLAMNSKLREARDLLLPRLMSGEVAV
jgi:type I restriction enzyme, S subunit